MTQPLHLVRLRLDARKLYAFARKSRAAGRNLDEGYAVHALFAALFDHGAAESERAAPKPFHIESSNDRTVGVLGYARLDHEALGERAHMFGDPDAWCVCDVDSLTSKPMPKEFKAGMRLGFHVRACPIRRIAKRGPMQKERAEVDAFVAKAWEVGSSVQLDREQVYGEWLAEELHKEGAAKLVSVSISNFHLGKFLRRTQGEDRKQREPKRPDVLFEGVLEVEDSEAFVRRLARGVGRHRSFGFGMLLLRPAAMR